MARRRRRDKQAERLDAAELEELRPYLGLAREIRREVDRVAGDAGAPVESLVDAIARIPDQERRQVARHVFEQLPPEQQWSVIAEAFDDDGLRAALVAERDVLAQRADVDAELRRRAAAARAAGQLDTATLAAGEVLSIGLSPERDAQAVLARGRASDAAARVITLRAEGTAGGLPPGTLRVLGDAFNPDGGYFVTAAYDRDAWEDERLDSHALVQVGAARGTGHPGTADGFEPVLFPGARVDVRLTDGDQTRTGRLHLGWAAVGTADIFSG